MILDPEFICHPTVCAVEDEYQILTPVKSPMLFMVKVGDRIFYDHCEGVLRSDTRFHRVTIPQDVLDDAGSYTVLYRKVIERKPYYPTFEDTVTITYPFRPVKKEGPYNIYMVADAHGLIDAASRAGSFFGENLDILIMNGDIADSSDNEDVIFTLYAIASNITKGQRPVIITRGNHDNRGEYAEHLPDYMPNRNGHTYYSVKLGSIWAAVIDCGEDKADDEAPYNGTICFSVFREGETQWLEKTASQREYEAYPHRLIISHVPFTYNDMSIEREHLAFNIEVERYTKWARLMKDEIKPELMLCGHWHKLVISEPGSVYDQKGQPCTAVIGSYPEKPDRFIGTALNLSDSVAEVLFTDQDGKVCEQHQLMLELQ